MKDVDALDCRSERRCPTCAHWRGGTCTLEAALEEALVALSLSPRPRLHPALALVDARPPASA